LKHDVTLGKEYLPVVEEMCSLMDWSKPVFNVIKEEGGFVVVEGLVNLNSSPPHGTQPSFEDRMNRD
jgi:hypothetical protein